MSSAAEHAPTADHEEHGHDDHHGDHGGEHHGHDSHGHGHASNPLETGPAAKKLGKAANKTLETGGKVLFMDQAAQTFVTPFNIVGKFFGLKPIEANSEITDGDEGGGHDDHGHGGGGHH